MTIQIAPCRPRVMLVGFSLIYGLTVTSCYLINEVVRIFPIGPWEGASIVENYWLDNVGWQIFAAWWACFFFCCGFFPFNRIEPKITRGVALTVVSWILGWLSLKMIYLIGPGVGGLFPLIGTTWFLLALLCFAGGNWPVDKLTPARQFLILLLMIAGGTYLITHSAIIWIPPWWFPFLLVGLGTTTLTYLFRDLSKPSQAFGIVLTLFACVCICLSVSSWLGVWDASAPSVSRFWNMGQYTNDQFWLLWFFTATSVHYALPTITANWPFSTISMPWGGVLASISNIVISILVARLLYSGIGVVFEDMNEALTYAYMGVNWSLIIPLIFGVGLEAPYQWATRKEQVEDTRLSKQSIA